MFDLSRAVNPRLCFATASQRLTKEIGEAAEEEEEEEEEEEKFVLVLRILALELTR